MQAIYKILTRIVMPIRVVRTTKESIEIIKQL
jgi:hypothetical protein